MELSHIIILQKDNVPHISIAQKPEGCKGNFVLFGRKYVSFRTRSTGFRVCKRIAYFPVLGSGAFTARRLGDWRLFDCAQGWFPRNERVPMLNWRGAQDVDARARCPRHVRVRLRRIDARVGCPRHVGGMRTVDARAGSPWDHGQDGRATLHSHTAVYAEDLACYVSCVV